MRRTNASILIIALLVALSANCGSRFVKKEEVQKISKDFEKVYILKEQLDIGNFDNLNKGAKVRIFFKTAGEYVSVYAYPYSQPREEAVGKNILQLFEADFPDKKFSEAVLRERIAVILDEYKGKLDTKSARSDFGSDLKKGKAPAPAKGSGNPGGGGGRGRRGR